MKYDSLRWTSLLDKWMCRQCRGKQTQGRLLSCFGTRSKCPAHPSLATALRHCVQELRYIELKQKRSVNQLRCNIGRVFHQLWDIFATLESRGGGGRKLDQIECEYQTINNLSCIKGEIIICALLFHDEIHLKAYLFYYLHSLKCLNKSNRNQWNK